MTEARSGPATTFAGAHQHPLEYVLRGTVDPSTGAGVPAAVGSIYLRDAAGAGQIWLKTGGADTAWTRITVP